MASQALHIAAASVWIGGLVMLAVFLLPRRAGGTLAQVLPRWSRTAAVAVPLLALSGAYQAWREVGTPPALPGTTYGRLLLTKLALFGVLLALGWLGRRWIIRRSRPVVHAAVDTQVAAAAAVQPSGPDEVRTLRRRVGAEILLGAAVLVVTSVLVAAAPARSSYGRRSTRPSRRGLSPCAWR